MKAYAISIIIAFVMVCTVIQPVLSAGQEKTVQLEILYMNHGPMQPTIREIQAMIQRYPGRIEARWFDFDQDAGRRFMKAKNLQGHIPLLVYINGAPAYNIQGREVTFMGFPSGAGPYQFQGKWSLKDLETVIQGLM